MKYCAYFKFLKLLKHSSDANILLVNSQVSNICIQSNVVHHLQVALYTMIYCGANQE